MKALAILGSGLLAAAALATPGAVDAQRYGHHYGYGHYRGYRDGYRHYGYRHYRPYRYGYRYRGYRGYRTGYGYHRGYGHYRGHYRHRY